MSAPFRIVDNALFAVLQLLSIWAVAPLPSGVAVAQRTLDPLTLVRIQARQPGKKKRVAY